MPKCMSGALCRAKRLKGQKSQWFPPPPAKKKKPNEEQHWCPGWQTLKVLRHRVKSVKSLGGQAASCSWTFRRSSHAEFPTRRVLLGNCTPAGRGKPQQLLSHHPRPPEVSKAEDHQCKEQDEQLTLEDKSRQLGST